LTRFAELLQVLANGGVEFIVIGGVAAAARGSARSTQDLDLVYSRSDENLRAMAACLAQHRPYLRGAPPGLPFRLDFDTLSAGLNFTLVTDLGWIDLFGEVAGGGRYEEILPHSTAIQVFGISCYVADLEMLIRMKKAAGRPKDFETVAELELLRERRPR
jgi:predicted nucleotidyltransferase